jgi:adenylate cyclase
LVVGKRRLAAIMFTDMVGYTALGQRNESLSLALVDQQRKLIRPILNRHNGREVKTMGDAFLVEFPSTLDAARCAYDIQRATREFNVTLPEEKRVHLRVGVHLGDVVETHGDISGDAVNIASRIEPLAEDGGVCLTRQVYDHVQNKFDVPLVSLGSKSLKNVNASMEVYKMMMPWEAQTTDETNLEKRRIAVMPFTNISPDPRDDYFADGMTEELISTLSRIRDLRVISRTSVMRYKGTSKNVGEIAIELRVGSILEGSVRKASDDLRISAQLIDAGSDEHLWSQDYDRRLENVFAIQREIAQSVAEALKIQLLSGEKKSIEKKPTENTEAHELYLKGRYYWNERVRESNDKAVKFFEEAVRLDPKYALAYSGLADCYLIYADRGWLGPGEGNAKGREYALRAVELDPMLAEAHASQGLAFMQDWMWPEAERELERAIELNPSYASAYQWYGVLLWWAGRYAEGKEKTEHASELDPLSSVIRGNLCRDLLTLGKRDEAMEQARRVAKLNPGSWPEHYLLSIILLMDSKFEDAISEAEKACDLLKGDLGLKSYLGFLYGMGGRKDQANKILYDLKEAQKIEYLSNVWVAGVLFGLERRNEAFEYLDKAFEERSTHLFYFRKQPWFKQFRTDERWLLLERRIGLLEALELPSTK